MSKKEIVFVSLKIMGITVLIAWLFYDSVWGLLAGLFIGPALLLDWREEKKRQEKYELEQQFQTGLVFAAGAMEAGCSIENAWSEMEQEMVRLYGKEAVFSKIIHRTNQQVRMNESMNILVKELEERSDSENIRNFAEVFYFARRSGGNMTEIMRKTANRISQNFQVQEEMQLALSSRKLELLIMNIMPFAILVYLRLCSGGFLSPLYHSAFGALIMSGCLGLYFFSWCISKKMIRIGV